MRQALKLSLCRGGGTTVFEPDLRTLISHLEFDRCNVLCFNQQRESLGDITHIQVMEKHEIWHLVHEMALLKPGWMTVEIRVYDSGLTFLILAENSSEWGTPS